MEESVREFLTNIPMGPMAIAILVAAALLEYIFPPFPGDTAVLAGAFLVATADWDPLIVILAVNAGSLVGIVIDYEFGGYVRHHDLCWRKRFRIWDRVGSSIDQVMPMFERRPWLYLVINRFLPSVRAFFFIAAGMAEVPRWKVLLLGGVSAFLWCLLLFSVGWWIGNDWERLVSIFTTYQRLVWLIIAIVVIFIARRIWKGQSQRS